MRRKKPTDPISILSQGYMLSVFLTEFEETLRNNPNQTISKFYKSVTDKLGIATIPGRTIVLTPGALLALLYIMIVYPKQIFPLKHPETKLDELDDSWGDIRIDVGKKDDMTLGDLVRRIRNAISHSRVYFDPDNTSFVFEDSPPGKPTDIRVVMSLDSLYKFTTALPKSIFSD